MTGAAMLRRLAQAAAVLLCMSFAVFFLMGLMPGDPVDLMAAGNPHLTPEGLARLRAHYGVDQPLWKRYARWLAAAAGGDFGYSRLYGLPVAAVVWPRLLNTLALLGAALALTVAAGVPLGVYAARHEGRARAGAVHVLALAGLSVPPFWMGLLFIFVFAARLGWLPAGAQARSPASMILPVLTVALCGLAVYVRHMAAAMAEALREDHIRTARAKGCAEARVVWGHAFRCALPPVLTVFMLDLGVLAGGTVTVETVFAFPGMGKMLFDAVMGNDYNLALVGFLFLTAMVLLANALADILHARLDPRIERAGA